MFQYLFYQLRPERKHFFLSRSIRSRGIKKASELLTQSVMEPILTLDDLLKEPDLLSTAINSIAPDGSLTQQQQQPNVQTYYYHPQQPQPTQPHVSQPKTGAVEVLLKEMNDLKKRVQQLEDQKPQRKTDPLELNPIRIP